MGPENGPLEEDIPDLNRQIIIFRSHASFLKLKVQPMVGWQLMRWALWYF